MPDTLATWQDVYDEFKTLLQAVWPDVAIGSFLDGSKAQREHLENNIINGKYPNPSVIVYWLEPRGNPNWSNSAPNADIPVEVIRYDKSTGDVELERQALGYGQALWNKLRLRDTLSFSIADQDPTVNVDALGPINAIASGDHQTAVYATTIRCTLLC